MAGLSDRILDDIKGLHKRCRGREHHEKRGGIESEYRNFENLWKRMNKIRRGLEMMRMLAERDKTI